MSVASIVFQALKADSEEETRQALIEVIAAIWKRGFRENIRQALAASLEKGESLAGLAGIFDGDTSERDLREGGIWGLRVRLLRDKHTGILQPQAGESGRIVCYYPVGLSTFDLSEEAPVTGLSSHPDTSIGVPWSDLVVERSAV